MNLKEAKKLGKLDEFIKEHDKDYPSDKDRVEDTIKSFSQKKKSIQETSGQDSDEN